MRKRWKCEECEIIHLESELLEAVNPFDAESKIVGCPNCKSVECFVAICDEPKCTHLASCGFPTPDGYRRTCYEHSDFAKESKA